MYLFFIALVITFLTSLTLDPSPRKYVRICFSLLSWHSKTTRISIPKQNLLLFIIYQNGTHKISSRTAFGSNTVFILSWRLLKGASSQVLVSFTYQICLFINSVKVKLEWWWTYIMFIISNTWLAWHFVSTPLSKITLYALPTFLKHDTLCESGYQIWILHSLNECRRVRRGQIKPTLQQQLVHTHPPYLYIQLNQSLCSCSGRVGGHLVAMFVG